MYAILWLVNLRYDRRHYFERLKLMLRLGTDARKYIYFCVENFEREYVNDFHIYKNGEMNQVFTHLESGKTNLFLPLLEKNDQLVEERIVSICNFSRNNARRQILLSPQINGDTVIDKIGKYIDTIFSLTETVFPPVLTNIILSHL
jgi:hypothetical protein